MASSLVHTRLQSKTNLSPAPTGNAHHRPCRQQSHQRHSHARRRPDGVLRNPSGSHPSDGPSTGPCLSFLPEEPRAQPFEGQLTWSRFFLAVTEHQTKVTCRGLSRKEPKTGKSNQPQANVVCGKTVQGPLLRTSGHSSAELLVTAFGQLQTFTRYSERFYFALSSSR